MNVGELRKVLEELPDDMPIVTYDEGYLQDEFCGTSIIVGGTGKDEYRHGEPGKHYLLVY
jgi:hypothetical protein